MTALALDPNSDVNLIFVTPEWLFTERLGNKAKVHDLDRASNLALIATSIMHAMVDVYHMDKAVIMEHLAALERTSLSYHDWKAHKHHTQYFTYG